MRQNPKGECPRRSWRQAGVTGAVMLALAAMRCNQQPTAPNAAPWFAETLTGVILFRTSEPTVVSVPYLMVFGVSGTDIDRTYTLLDGNRAGRSHRIYFRADTPTEARVRIAQQMRSTDQFDSVWLAGLGISPSIAGRLWYVPEVIITFTTRAQSDPMFLVRMEGGRLITGLASIDSLNERFGARGFHPVMFPRYDPADSVAMGKQRRHVFRLRYEGEMEFIAGEYKKYQFVEDADPNYVAYGDI